MGNNMDKYVVSDCALLIVARFFLRLVLRHFFSTLAGVLTSVTLGGTKKYVLIGFMVLLLLTISSNARASSEAGE